MLLIISVRHVGCMVSCHLVLLFFYFSADHLHLLSFPTRRSSDLLHLLVAAAGDHRVVDLPLGDRDAGALAVLDELLGVRSRSEEHTSELQSRENLVCRLLLEKKKSCKSGCCTRRGQCI